MTAIHLGALALGPFQRLQRIAFITADASGQHHAFSFFIIIVVHHLVEPLRWRQNSMRAAEMITQRTEESKQERLERQQRELEQMRQAVANYSGPITKCPRYKTSDPNARPRGLTRRARFRNADGRID